MARGLLRWTTRRLQGERGQTLVLLMVFLVVLLGAAALSIDIGRAWYAKRQVQAAVDAAALAAAQELPTPDNVAAVGEDYFHRNPVRGVTSSSATLRTRCLADAPVCDNVVDVDATVSAPSIFGRVLGIDSYRVSAHASACNPCGERPLDIVVVLDRTGSMGQGGSPNKITNARAGVLSLLGYMDPNVVKIGLVVLPPVESGSTVCKSAGNGAYDAAASKFLVVPLSGDYKTGGAINDASPLVSAVKCVKEGGSTAYATAIDAAKAELAAHGRAKVQPAIIFLTDGAANTGSHLFGAADPIRTQPCHAGVSHAATAKAAGIWVYTIGYAIGGDQCQPDGSNAAESPSITPAEALLAMATDASHYYSKPDTGQLNTVFSSIAADISAQASLIR
jgi:Flp pilus assembly protein TadG